MFIQNEKNSNEQEIIELTRFMVRKHYCENDIEPVIALMDDEIVLVVSVKHPLCKYEEVSIKSLADYPYIAYYKSINLRDFTDEYCRMEGGFTPGVVFETADWQAIRYMISKNKGISLMPKSLFEIERSDDYKIIRLKEKTFRTLVIAWDEKKILSPQATQFLKFTKNWFRNF